MPGAGGRPGPSAALRCPAPPALPARAWRGASAAGEGRGRAGPRPPLSHGAPPPHRVAAALPRAGPGVAVPLRSGGEEGEGRWGRRRPEQSGGSQLPYPGDPSKRSGQRKKAPLARPPAHRERGLSAAAARRPRTGAEGGGGGDWPERFPPGRPRRGVCPGPRLPRCRHSLTWRPPPPGRAGGASAERREPGPSTALSAEGNNRPERRLRPRNGPPLRPAPSRPPTAPIGQEAPFESWVAARYWLPPDGAVLPPEARRPPEASVRGRAGRLGPLTATRG